MTARNMRQISPDGAFCICTENSSVVDMNHIAAEGSAARFYATMLVAIMGRKATGDTIANQNTGITIGQFHSWTSVMWLDQQYSSLLPSRFHSQALKSQFKSRFLTFAH